MDGFDDVGASPTYNDLRLPARGRSCRCPRPSRASPRSSSPPAAEPTDVELPAMRRGDVGGRGAALLQAERSLDTGTSSRCTTRAMPQRLCLVRIVFGRHQLNPPRRANSCRQPLRELRRRPDSRDDDPALRRSPIRARLRDAHRDPQASASSTGAASGLLFDRRYRPRFRPALTPAAPGSLILRQLDLSRAARTLSANAWRWWLADGRDPMRSGGRGWQRSRPKSNVRFVISRHHDRMAAWAQEKA